MNSIGWNCRGLENPQLVRALHDLVRCWDPKIVFLLETKVRQRCMERIKKELVSLMGSVFHVKGVAVA